MHIAPYSMRNHGIAANVCIMLIFSAQAPGFVFFKKGAFAMALLTATSLKSLPVLVW